MQTSGAPLQWFAIRIATGREKLVSQQFRNKGYEDFLPQYRSKRKWSDRTKELEIPLFPGYLFCRFDFSHRLPILVTPGVKLIVGYGKEPTPVTSEEIESLRRVVASGASATPWPYLSAGQKVRVQDGAMAGVEGILLQVKNSYRIVLSVELLQRSVAVELDRSSVVPVRSAPIGRAEFAASAASRNGEQFLLKSAI